MKTSFQKTITLFIVSGFVFSPVLELTSIQAATLTPATDSSGNLIPRAYTLEGNPYSYDTNTALKQANIDAQIAASIGRASSTNNSSTNPLTAPVSNAAGCGAGQILASVITSSVSSAFSSATSQATDALKNADKVKVAESGDVADTVKTTANANIGATVGLGGIRTLTAPSWDSVAYCIVNAMIIYIADSTIQWIKTGFKGNPAFLENPDAFFQQLADEEAASFVQNLAYGVTGVNVCNVFRAVMVQSILNQYSNRTGLYNRGYGSGANKGINNGFLGCTFDQNPNQLNSFVKGNFIQGGGWNSWYQISQNPTNNPYDTYFNTTDRLNNQKQAVQTSQAQQLNWSNGFLSYRQCDKKASSTAPGKTVDTNCKIVTPGTVIQNELNSTLDLGKNRLVLATKFDQVVSALISQLISTALGSALSGTKK